MPYAVCCVAVSPLRAEPSHRSEMVTQQLFGESCEILEREKDHWIKIRCQYDGYEGWCQDSHVTSIEQEQFRQGERHLTPEWANEIEYNGRIMMVPYGSSLTSLKNGQAFWRRNTVYYKGKTWDPYESKPTGKLVKQLAYKFYNTPYLWGGKSVFGTDCSGFSQTVFKFLGLPLLRDTYQQCTQGEAVGFLQEAKCGDLAFFDNEDRKITHVGILLNPHEIIHASGRVRVDKIDNLGIVNSETAQRTHQLRIIRRYFNE